MSNFVVKNVVKPSSLSLKLLVITTAFCCLLYKVFSLKLLIDKMIHKI